MIQASGRTFHVQRRWGNPREPDCSASSANSHCILLPSASPRLVKLKAEMRATPERFCLQRIKERDQGLPFFGREFESELVPFHRSGIDSGAFPSSRPVIIAQASRIEPVLDGGPGAVVLKWAAVPHTLQRRDLVVTGPPSGR